MSDHATEQIVTSCFTSATGCRCHCEQRPETLATGVNQVGCDLVEVGISKNHRFGEEDFELAKVSLDLR